MLLTPVRAVMGIFFLHGAILANWFPRIPEVQERLGLGPADLGIALLGMPVATLVSLPLAGSLIERLSARRTIYAGFIAYCAAVTLIGWSWNMASLFATTFLVGLAYPIIDVSMNVEANRIEEGLGRRIMITCHAFWSVGSMVGAFAGAGFAALAIDPRWHLLIVAAAGLPVSLVLAAALPVVPRAAVAHELRRPVFALPTRGLIGLCVFAIGIVMVEIAARNWSAVYLRDVLAASPATAGLAYGSFTMCMAVGRFFGDRLSDRYGAVPLARACCLLMLAGEVVAVLADNAVLAIVGFGAAGLGVSVGFPLMMTAAATHGGGRPASTNVAAIALAVSVAFLAGPPVIGFVGEAAGLRIGMALILPAALLSLAFAGELRRRVPAGAPGGLALADGESGR